jgi:hypothetical protein
MSELSIHIGWEYFLGVVGTLIGIAYYTNGRLTRLETSMEWVKDTLTRLTAKLEPDNQPEREIARPKVVGKRSRRAAIAGEQ